MHLLRRAQAVSGLYRRLDLHAASFRAASGLECPAGCGRCCVSAEVEATVLEMLPAAFRLQRDGRLERTLAELESLPATCVLCLPQPAPPARGHCGLYDHRPLLCRLFGFAARLDREGARALSSCRLIRAAEPERTARAEQAVRERRVVVPVMGDYRMKLYGIDPSLGARPLPINLALAQALEMVGLESRHRRVGPG